MNSNILNRQQQYAVVALSVMLSLMVVWAAAYGATTISENISTGGTLTVTGASTLTGNVSAAGTLSVTGLTTLVNASTTQVSASGFMWVGGMATTTGSTGAIDTEGALTVKGGATLGDAAGDAIVLTGNASTTNGLTVGGNLIASASSTVSGNFNASGSITAGASSSPAYSFGASGTATTTLSLNTTSSNTGACIQVIGSNGSYYRMYFAPSDSVGAATTSWRGGTAYYALWEAGTCK